MRVPLRVRTGGFTFVCLAVFTGCSSDRFGADLDVHPRMHALRSTEPVTMRLPKDEPFSIALESARRAPGLDGDADATAEAKPTGFAEVSASVARSGNAEGLFRLGHAFVNDTDRQMDLDFAVQFRYEFEVRHEPDARLPDASAGLRLYARDGRGRMLRDLGLVSYSTETGPASRASDEQFRFVLTLGPGEAVDVFLAGRAKADVPAERTASARLKLSGLEFEVATRPAPAIQATSHESY
jgi:hypothetical protein